MGHLERAGGLLHRSRGFRRSRSAPGLKADGWVQIARHRRRRIVRVSKSSTVCAPAPILNGPNRRNRVGVSVVRLLVSPAQIMQESGSPDNRHAASNSTMQSRPVSKNLAPTDVCSRRLPHRSGWALEQGRGRNWAGVRANLVTQQSATQIVHRWNLNYRNQTKRLGTGEPQLSKSSLPSLRRATKLCGS